MNAYNKNKYIAAVVSYTDAKCKFITNKLSGLEDCENLLTNIVENEEYKRFFPDNNNIADMDFIILKVVKELDF